MKTDITIPLSLVAASTATFLGNAAMHYLTFGNDTPGFFAFRFFTEPAIVILLVLVPAAIVLILRLYRHRRAVWFDRKPAYFWLIGTLLLLGLIASLAFSGIDEHEYWLMIIIYWTPKTLLVSFVLGIAAMFGLSFMVKR